METPILKDKDLFPDERVLREALRGSWPAYVELLGSLKVMGIEPQWNYYRDGYVWLCKLLRGKKNLGWLSVYEGYFLVTCYFLERHTEQIGALDISPDIKAAFYRQKPCGKLIPMTVTLRDEVSLPDVLAMLEFKKKAK